MNEENVCETYIKKGLVDGVDVESCADYCNAHDLSCKEQHEDDNGCTKKERYTSCDETGKKYGGGNTNDHICVCGMSMIH